MHRALFALLPALLLAACGVGGSGPPVYVPPRPAADMAPPADMLQCLPPPNGPGDPDNCGCAGVACQFNPDHPQPARVCCPQGCGSYFTDTACGSWCSDCTAAGLVCEYGRCIKAADKCKVYPTKDWVCPTGYKWLGFCCVPVQ